MKTTLFTRATQVLPVRIRQMLHLATGVTLAVGGLAITGGSFGLFAFIGIPLMAIGLGMITAENGLPSQASAGVDRRSAILHPVSEAVARPGLIDGTYLDVDDARRKAELADRVPVEVGLDA